MLYSPRIMDTQVDTCFGRVALEQLANNTSVPPRDIGSRSSPSIYPGSRNEFGKPRAVQPSFSPVD